MTATPLHVDVAIVVGGHNGLSAACYLAEAGKKVLVIEALDKAGGMASSGYLIPEAPQHLVHPCALDLMSLRGHPMMPQELQLERHGFKQVEMTPGYVYLHPDGSSLVFWRDVHRTAAEIRRFSEADAAEFIELMKVVNAFIDMAIPMMRVDPTQKNFGAKFEALKALLRNRHLKPEIMGMMGSPAYQVIMERFEHPVTQSALCCLLGAAGPITNEATGVFFALLGFLLRTGVGRVIGGMQSLSNAMVARLNELGGSVLLNALVAEIIAESGKNSSKVTGVRLQDGRIINANAVVASIHPRMAFERVTPGRAGPPRHDPRAPGPRQCPWRRTAEGGRGGARPDQPAAPPGSTLWRPGPAQVCLADRHHRCGAGELPRIGAWRGAQAALYVEPRAERGRPVAGPGRPGHRLPVPGGDAGQPGGGLGRDPHASGPAGDRPGVRLHDGLEGVRDRPSGRCFA